MELFDAIIKRRSIRKYTWETIPEDKLEKIVQAGLLAPTSRNIKPCELYVVRDKRLLELLSHAKSAGGAFIRDADAAVVVLADESRADTWIEDSSIALSYMNLMAVDQGIGACWVQIHMRKDADGSDAEANVREILSAPDNYRVVGILPLGIADQERPANNPDELDYSKVHLL